MKIFSLDPLVEFNITKKELTMETCKAFVKLYHFIVKRLSYGFIIIYLTDLLFQKNNFIKLLN